MEVPSPLVMYNTHVWTPSPQEQEQSRLLNGSDDMGVGDREDGHIRGSSNPQQDGGNTARPRTSTQGRQKLCFTDPVAFRYLEEDPDTIVLDRRRRLEGYELYLVEQWACSRTHPTFLVCTYTGDMSKSVIVDVLSASSDPTAWSPRLKLYFDAISQYHAKPRETPYGDIMVTNLAGFPSNLTVISVPDGDVRKHREDFIVNENLKRMGCTGRAAINLQRPQQSTISKFHQLYRTSESVEIYQAVIELVKLSQKGLTMYGCLAEAYTDGLFCDITEKAITEWWTEIGVYFYNTEPSDGTLGPSTVAAVLGLLVGAYNRLKAYGAPVGKDIFDIAGMKRAVGSFQKAVKIERSRRLDRETLDRLHRATAKTASGEGWTVPRAVKSTLAEVSGKGGEMVMGIVGGKDKAGISEVETLDIDRFAQLVIGPRMRWLWLGKSKPLEVRREANDGIQGRVFSTDDQGGFIWAAQSQTQPAPGLERTDTISSLPSHGAEGKSGLGRIREAVGGKLHSQRPGHEREDTDYNETPGVTPGVTPGLSAVSSKAPEPPTTPMDQRPPQLDQALKEASPYANTKRSPQSTRLQPAMPRPSMERSASYRAQLRPAAPTESPRKQQIQREMALLRNALKAPKYTNFTAEFAYSGPKTQILRRSHSAIQTIGTQFDNFPRQNRLNRQLSFSIVEPTVLTFPDLVTDSPPPSPTALKKPSNADLFSGLTARDALAAHAQKRSRRITALQDGLVPFTESRVAHVEGLDHDAGVHLEELNSLYYQKLEEYQTLQATSADVMNSEKGQLTEGLRRIEVLGAKLDYELNALQGRVQEVEDGVDEFERGVRGVEGRVEELLGGELEGEGKRRMGWMQRVVNVLGGGK